MSANKILLIASIMGALAVIMGAFGAHALRSRLAEEQLNVWQTGIQYQFYHCFALLVCALLMLRQPLPGLGYAAICFTIGILCFSGSLYILACRDLLNITNTSIIGPITPIGGMFFIIGWVLLAAQSFKF